MHILNLSIIYNFKVVYTVSFAIFVGKFLEGMVEITKDQVQSFLEKFHSKLKIFDILYLDNREKNKKTLEVLEIVPSYRKVVIESLSHEDYVEGPLIDTLNKRGEMWVFGKDVKGREIYIKIMLGIANSQTICISFHISEHPLKYPFK